MMKHPLHIAHVGLLDAAPLLVAQESGFFVAEGLDVTLSCDLGLATICGKLADRKLDGACLPAPLPVLLSLGAGVPRVLMQAVAISCWQGMGVVMASPRVPSRTAAATVRMGVVAPGTPTRLLLHRLVQSPGNPLPGEITAVPMAASQLTDFLREGMLDGFCGIDPLPALARILAGAECIADSAGLSPLHPGSVVALRSERVGNSPQLLGALERAVVRGREYCADPAHFAEMWRLVLKQAPYSELDAEARAALLAGAATGHPSWVSMRFDAPGERGGLSTAAESFLDNACRGAAGPSARTLDLKAEIARVFSRRPAALSHQTVNT